MTEEEAIAMLKLLGWHYRHSGSEGGAIAYEDPRGFVSSFDDWIRNSPNLEDKLSREYKAADTAVQMWEIAMELIGAGVEPP